MVSVGRGYADTHIGSQSTGSYSLGSAGSSDTAMPDLFTGVMTYSIPIEVPMGRNGMKPDIVLTYRSNNGNGWMGQGWELEFGAIQRTTKSGVNYTGDDYQLKIRGATLDLVNIGNYSTYSEYRVKIENDFFRIRKYAVSSLDSNQLPYWEITNKSGVRFLFGQTTNSRQDFLPSSTASTRSDIFKWCLDEIDDPNGNVITFSYWKDISQRQYSNGQTYDNGQIYLSQISYGSNKNTILPATNFIRFYIDTTTIRSDAQITYDLGHPVKTTGSLSLINVYTSVNGNTSSLRSYKLDYQASGATDRLLLRTVTQFGNDANIDSTGIITNQSGSSAEFVGSFRGCGTNSGRFGDLRHWFWPFPRRR